MRPELLPAAAGGEEKSRRGFAPKAMAFCAAAPRLDEQPPAFPGRQAALTRSGAPLHFPVYSNDLTHISRTNVLLSRKKRHLFA